MTTPGALAQVLPLDRLVFDEATWPRSGLDHSRVEEFIVLYQDGGPSALPPLEAVSDGTRILQTDGRHRREALEQLGYEEAVVCITTTEFDEPLEAVAFERALEASARSALPLTRAERRQAALRLLATSPEYADREIARLAGLSHQTVGRLRQRSNGPATTEDAAERYRAETSADELARRMVRGAARLWDARGLSDRLLGDRTGRRIATELRTTHGDEALDWAQRMQGWLNVAVRELKGGR